MAAGRKSTGKKPDRNDPMFDDFGLWMFENDPKAKAKTDKAKAGATEARRRTVKTNTKKK